MRWMMPPTRRKSTSMMTELRYSEMIRLPSFSDRFEYLKLDGHVGYCTFDSLRYLNQRFYTSQQWRRIRREVIIRDNGCDLAHPDRPIDGRIYIHHLCPLTDRDILEATEHLTNPEFLVCTSFETHQAIHYGGETYRPRDYVPRRPNDTAPWRR